MSICTVCANLNDEEFKKYTTADLILMLLTIVEKHDICDFIMDENRKFENTCRNILFDKVVFPKKDIAVRKPFEISPYEFFSEEVGSFYIKEPCGDYWLVDTTTIGSAFEHLNIEKIIKYENSNIYLIMGTAIW